MSKILIYFNSMQPSGGIERVIATLSNKLSDRHEITILVKDEPKSFYTLNEEIVVCSLGNEMKLNMDSRISRMFTSFKTVTTNSSRLRSFLKENDFDYYYLAHPLNVLEFYFAAAQPEKIIITEHGARSAYNKVYRLIKKLLYKRAKAYVVPTKTDTVLYKKDGFPAIYIPHFRSALPYVIASRTAKVVLNIGRFTPDKQQLALLAIWARIINVHGVDDWKLQIAGKGELEDQLKNYVNEHNLSDFVTFLPPTRNVEDYYKGASVFALTSSSEGFGMVLLEAISFGIPCVSYDCPSGPRDIIKSDYNGYLIPLNDGLMFEERLLSLLKDKRTSDLLALNAFEYSSNWKDDKIISQWYDLLSKVC
jgi:glycosyltransferase involved in cell wall biosynthesis